MLSSRARALVIRKYIFPKRNRSTPGHDASLRGSVQSVEYVLEDTPGVRSNLLRNEWGEPYGIQVVHADGSPGMTFPYGTYTFKPRSRTFTYWMYHPDVHDLIFRRGIRVARVDSDGIYKLRRDGHFVQVEGAEVSFQPRKHDVLSKDGVHRYAIYVQEFRLLQSNHRTLIE